MQQDDPSMTAGHPSEGRGRIDQLVAALTTVQKLGVRNPQLVPPPILLSALGISPTGPKMRQQFQSGLQSACGMLEKDRRMAFLIAAGLRPDVMGPRGHVVKQIQVALSTSRRTAYRRINEAIQDLALLLDGGNFLPAVDGQKRRTPEEGLDFVTLDTQCVVDLATDTPWIQMTRTIQALRHGLTGLDENIVLPGLNGQEPGYAAITSCTVDDFQLTGETLKIRLEALFMRVISRRNATTNTKDIDCLMK